MSRIRNGMQASGLRGITWVKSSRSGPTGGNCVEMGVLPGGTVAVRNSRHPEGPALIFTAAEWDAFVRGLHPVYRGYAPRDLTG
jgi:Domain of unknown function (DUF397)